jgi:hypothetical protein
MSDKGSDIRFCREIIQCDSELLLGFPWPIIFTPKITE